MRYEAISRVNGGCWESDPYVGEIEADSCEDALEQYLDVIADNLRAVNAVFSGKCGDIVEYRYDDVILEITMKEIEEDSE